MSGKTVVSELWINNGWTSLWAWIFGRWEKFLCANVKDWSVMNKSNQKGKNNWLTWKSHIKNSFHSVTFSPFPFPFTPFPPTYAYSNLLKGWERENSFESKVNPKYLSQIPPNNADAKSPFSVFTLNRNSFGFLIELFTQYNLYRRDGECIYFLLRQKQRKGEQNNILPVKTEQINYIYYLLEFYLCFFVLIIICIYEKICRDGRSRALRVWSRG